MSQKSSSLYVLCICFLILFLYAKCYSSDKPVHRSVSDKIVENYNGAVLAVVSSNTK